MDPLYPLTDGKVRRYRPCEKGIIKFVIAFESIFDYWLTRLPHIDIRIARSSIIRSNLTTFVQQGEGIVTAAVVARVAVAKVAGPIAATAVPVAAMAARPIYSCNRSSSRNRSSSSSSISAAAAAAATAAAAASARAATV